MTKKKLYITTAICCVCAIVVFFSRTDEAIQTLSEQEKLQLFNPEPATTIVKTIDPETNEVIHEYEYEYSDNGKVNPEIATEEIKNNSGVIYSTADVAFQLGENFYQNDDGLYIDEETSDVYIITGIEDQTEESTRALLPLLASSIDVDIITPGAMKFVTYNDGSLQNITSNYGKSIKYAMQYVKDSADERYVTQMSIAYVDGTAVSIIGFFYDENTINQEEANNKITNIIKTLKK